MIKWSLHLKWLLTSVSELSYHRQFLVLQVVRLLNFLVIFSCFSEELFYYHNDFGLEVIANFSQRVKLSTTIFGPSSSASLHFLRHILRTFCLEFRSSIQRGLMIKWSLHLEWLLTSVSELSYNRQFLILRVVCLLNFWVIFYCFSEELFYYHEDWWLREVCTWSDC